ncbi:MAG: hypothetical protein HQM10_13910 [Candidatus Riflebacteria bacterium]|nr:hypothetical protein [Candidatus Riflebacteria bacterium]
MRMRSLQAPRLGLVCFFLVAMLTVLEPSLAITITNETKGPVSVRAYYTQWSKGNQAGKIVTLKPGSSATIDRPPFKTFKDREIFIGKDPGQLNDHLPERDYRSMSHFNIGNTKGELFWIAMDKGQYKGFNAVEWVVVKPILEKAGELFSQAGQAINQQIEKLTAPIINGIKSQWAKHPYANQTASVRTGIGLCQDETDFRTARMKKVRPALEKLLDLEIAEKDIPTIAFAVTGGGFRAAVGCVGFILGVKEAGLYDVATYFATLSGSTWALGPWFLGDKSIEEFRLRLGSGLKENLALPNPSKDELTEIAKKLIGKTVQNQPVTIIDFWGSLLARKLLSEFGGNAQYIGISPMTQRAKKAEDPLPIFTAVANNICPDSNHEWFEFTPFEMGSDFLGAFVPVWAWGREFAGGRSTDFDPEESLAFGMGVFGSAFSVRIGDIIDNTFLANINDNQAFRYLLDPILEKFRREVEEVRKATVIPGGEIPNFAFDLPKAPASAKGKKMIKLSDAGHCSNIPVAPLLRKNRTADIIIVFDFSTTMVDKDRPTVKGPPDLRKASEYCKRKGLPFPQGPWEKAGGENLTVFGDPSNVDQPLILYIPRIKNPRLPGTFGKFDPETAVDSYAGTMGSQYTKDQLFQWSDYVKLDMLELKPRILELIKARVQARQAATAK